jgi:hypothetical protein
MVYSIVLARNGTTFIILEEVLLPEPLVLSVAEELVLGPTVIAGVIVKKCWFLKYFYNNNTI